jgi:hypothetical protein
VRKAVRTAVNSGEDGVMVGFQRAEGVVWERGLVGDLGLGVGVLASWNRTVLGGEVGVVVVRRRLRAGVPGREVGMEGGGRFFLALLGMRLVRRERSIIVVLWLLLCWLLVLMFE